MTEPNIPTRAYNAPRRAEQAAATRRAIVSAAHDLFVERGYAATTMAAIAQEAGVTAKSVHAVAEKSQLLLMAFDQAGECIVAAFSGGLDQGLVGGRRGTH